MKVGDRVLVSAHGQERVPATVVLASPEGARQSLMLEFPGGLFRLADAGAYVGTMPVLETETGWIEIINQRPIRIEPAPPSITCPFCGFVSYNPNDIRERYCGGCHRFRED